MKQSLYKALAILVIFKAQILAEENPRIDAADSKKSMQETTLTFPFYDDFENGFGNWLVSCQDWDTTSFTFRSPTHSINESPGGNYPVNSNATIQLANPINLPSTNTPVLSFWHRYNVQTNFDFCYVEISEDGRFNWSTLASYTGFVNTLFPSQIDLSNYKTSPILTKFLLRDNGNTTYDGWYIDDVEIKDIVTGIDDPTSEILNVYALNQNYPNPFNPSTTIRFNLPKAAQVKLTVFNVLGQQVAELLNKRKPAGEHSVTFDGRNLSSGVTTTSLKQGTLRQVPQRDRQETRFSGGTENGGVR